MNSKKNYPLTTYQQDIWLKHKINPNNPLCNIGGTVEISGNFDYQKLNNAINKAIGNNDALRIQIYEQDGKPFQVFVPELKYELPFFDFSDKNNSKQFAKTWMQERFLEVFEFDIPLFDFALIKVEEKLFFLLTKAHHIIADGMGITQLNQEIVNYYNNDENELNGNIEKISFKDLIKKDEEYLKSTSYQKDIEFWLNEYATIPERLFDYNNKSKDSTEISSKRTQYFIKRSEYDKIVDLCTKNGCTELQYFVTLVSLYLFRLYNKDEIVIDIPVLNRDKKERQIICHCTNAIPLRIKINDSSTFIELLKDVKIRLAKSYRHYKLSYGQIVRGLKLKNENLSDITLSYEVHDRKLNYLNVETHSTTLTHQHEQQTLNIQINQASVSEDVVIYIDYLLEIFNDLFPIENVISHFKTITNDTLQNHEKKIKDVEILTIAEKYQLLVEWNNTTADYPRDKCIHQLFEEQVERTPENIAAVFENMQLTYWELNEKSNQLARCLQSQGVKPETLVGICVDRSLDMIVGLLGILKAGGAYVPIDPIYPEKRISYMLEDAECGIVLSQKRLILPEPSSRIIYLDADWDRIKNEPAENVKSEVKSDNLAYVIYTSGSTGEPKGVCIEHRNTYSLLKWAQTIYTKQELEGTLASTSINFDLSVFELYLPLSIGCSIILEKNILSVKESINKQKITLINTVPSGIKHLLEQKTIPPLVKVINLAGEYLSKEIVEEIYAQVKAVRVYDLYGPSEDTTYTTFSLRTSNGHATIGKPINNTNIFILDKIQKLVPVGIPGELCISGDGLARGYLRRPELTAEKFIKNPFSDDPNSRLYKTGDLARYLPDGNIEFIGRIDNQVKIRGFRIELGEIESALSKIETIKDSVVVAKEDANSNKRLVAYIISDDGLNIQEIRGSLSKSLPDYMIPSLFVKLEKMPLNPNGKIDRKALPDLEGNIEITNEYVAPRNETEQKLAVIWSKVLGVEKVGIHDNFFELGGDSIITIQLVSRANQENISLTPKDIFKHKTIAELVKVSNTNGLKIIAEQGQISGEIALTPIQSWFFEEDFENKDHWNQAVMLKVKNTIDISMLENAINALIQQHDVLRLSYAIEKGKWIQKHTELLEYQLEVVDYSNLSGEELSKSVEEYSSKIQESLSIRDGVMLKATLFKTDNGKELLLAINHLVVDGVSWRIMIEDLQKACLQQIGNKKIALGLKTSSFKQWSEKLVEYANSDKLAKELEFWQEIVGKSNSSLPFDYSGENTGVSARNITVKLSRKLTLQLLKEVGKAYRTEINDLLLTALAISLEKWTRNNEIVIGLEGHGREELFNDTDISRTVGWFTTKFHVCLTLEKENSIAGTIKSVKEQLRRIPNKGIGYGILRYLHPDASVREQLGMQKSNKIGFNYLGQFDNLQDDGGLISISNQPTGESVSNANHRTNIVDINSLISNGELAITFSYSENLHKKETIQGLANSYAIELQNIVEHCLQPESKGFTPSDFPLCKITQKELDEYVLSGIETDNLESVYPLSPMQGGMLFHALYSSTSEVYMTQMGLDFVGQLDIPAFNTAWQAVIDKHTILRTSFVSEGVSKPLQRVHKHVKCDVEIFDFREFKEEEMQAKFDTLSENDRKKGFDIAKAPLSKFKLIKVSENKHRFIWTHHHILLDGWCLPIIFNAFYENYQAACKGEEVRVENIDKYEDFISYLGKQDSGKAEEFWEDYLKGFESPTPIPVGNNNQNADETDAYKQTSITLNSEDTKLLNNFSKDHHLTVNTLVQSAWSLLLSRYSGEDDIVFGVTVSGRPPYLPGVEQKVGLYINTLPLRVKVDGDQNAIGWLKDLQGQQPLLREYEYMPLANIQSLSEVSSRENLFNSILVFENYPIGELGNTENSLLRIENVQSFEKTNYPLTISASVGNNLIINISYNEAIYSTEIIGRTLGHLREVLLNIVKHAEKPISELEILTSAEKHQLLVEWNDTKVDYPRDKCIPQLFEEQVAKTPDKTALVFSKKEISYGELNKRANQLAKFLRKKGVKPESIVGILMDRSIDSIICILGVLKAGGAYLPLDIRNTKSRLEYILDNSNAEILLTNSGNEIQFKGYTIFLQDENIRKQACSSIKLINKPTDLIYVIYTSGSSGNPKGVMVEHRNVVAYVHAYSKIIGAKHDDICVQMASIAFDHSVEEIFTTILYGGTLIILKEEEVIDVSRFVEIINQHKVTRINCFAAILNELNKFKLFPSVHTITSGTDTLKLEYISNISKYAKIYNTYGPTEGTVCATYYSINEKLKTKIPIGTPIPNWNVYILNKNRKLTPKGVIGELYIGGAGVSRGYMNNIDLTNEKFVNNPYKPDEKIYRTGDLACWLPDGNIEFLGRIDNQIKIRGYRIELGEIEAIINKIETIKDCLVVAKEDLSGNKRLLAYIVSSNKLNVQKIREVLSKSLPEYMIPSLFMSLEKMPLTLNGKIDRKALPEPEGNVETTNEYVAPRNKAEQKLAAIWSKILGVEKISIYDNFFELGGHSLLATQVISKIRNEFNVELPLKTLFEKPRFVNLSDVIEKTKSVSKIAKIPVSSRDIDMPLSFAQERLWFIDQYEHNDSYNMSGAVKLFGKLNINVLKKTFSEIIRRHEVLRTNFITRNNVVSQFIHKESKFELKTIDQSHLLEEDANQKILELVKIESQKPFDLANDSLIRLVLYKINDEEHILFLNKHHIISDGWSFSIFLKEISILYKAFGENKPSPLPELEIQYADYAVWQREHIEGEILTKQSEYWKNKLSGTAILKLPTDKMRPSEQTFNGTSLNFSLDKDVSGKLNTFSKENDATLFMTLLSVFNVLLNKYTGQDDICVGSGIANRTRSEIEGLIGFFVNAQALRSKVNIEESFVVFLESVKQTTLEAYENQDLPFERIVDIVELERNLSYSPLFQVAILLQNTPNTELYFSGLKLESFGFESTTSKYDLTLDFKETKEGIDCRVEYNTDLFYKSTIERIIDHYTVLVECILQNPEKQIKYLDILTKKEKHQLLVEWNNTDIDYPKDKCIHQLFEERVDKTPNNIAVIFEKEELTYFQLNERANKLGHYLQKKGVKMDVLVGICVERSLDMLVGLLGIMKSGGAYVPVDPTYPEERITYIFEDADCEIVLTQEHLKLPKINSEIICLDTDWEGIENEPDENVNSEVKSDNLAYVIYTSGSTGRPKGVMIEHAGICNLQQEQVRIFNIEEKDIILQFASFSFDASVSEIFIALSKSAKLVLCKKERLKDAEELTKIINDYKISVITLPPTMLRLLNNNLPTLKTLISAGELCPTELVRKWAKNVAFYNAYGPTENTVCASIYKCLLNDINSLPIGKAIGNNKLYILDSDLKLVPIGVAGELCISGDGLARGYLKRPELTAEKFIKNPFSDAPNSRLYRTGDLVKYLPDGNIEFIGRIDNQVKIRGFRIELGEIEDCLLQHEKVDSAILSIIENTISKTKEIVAYIKFNIKGINRKALNQQRVDRWLTVYDQNYTIMECKDENDFTGWNSSYTGLPISEQEMSEWLENTIDLIKQFKPINVFEIGCGTGLVLFKLVAHCKKYYGIDFSSVSVDSVKEIIETDKIKYKNVEVHQSTADNIKGIELKEIDTIIINSVVQYFPDLQYLEQVLIDCIEKINDSGVIIIGDIRNYQLIEDFYRTTELYNLEDEKNLDEFNQMIKNGIKNEKELLIDPQYFVSLQKRFQRISHVDIRYKQGIYQTEMNKYRYNVILHINKEKTKNIDIRLDWNKEINIYDELQKVLKEESPDTLCIENAPNFYLEEDKDLNEKMGNNQVDIKELKRLVKNDKVDGFNSVFNICSEDYRKEIVWNNTKYSCDILFVRKGIDKGLIINKSERFENKERIDYSNDTVKNDYVLESKNEIKKYLEEKLPEYMIPSYFVEIEKIPLTPNGKIDRKVLPDPRTERILTTNEYIAPQTGVEKKLVGIWQELLGVDRIGVYDNFFELGGHSLLATQVISKIRTEFNIELPLKTLFEKPVLLSFSKIIENTKPENEIAKVTVVTRDYNLPLSYAQERLWFIDKYEHNASYNMPGAVKLIGKLDINVLERAFSEIIRRHEVLRTNFVTINNVACQLIHKESKYELKIVDQSHLSEEEANQKNRELIEVESQRPFDLANESLIRLILYKINDENHTLFLNKHHIISDGWSFSVFFKEISILYKAYSENKPSPLPELEIQYADYTVWQRGYIEGEVLTKQSEYWKNKLLGTAILELPTDKTRPVEQTFNGATLHFNLDKEILRKLNIFSKENDVTLFMTLLSAFKVLINKYTGQDDICVGTPIANRTRSEIEPLIGFFVNTLALRSNLSGGICFVDLVKQVKQTTLDAYSNQDIPFEKVVETVQPERNLSYSPLFQVMMVLQNTPMGELSFSELILKPIDLKFNTSKFDLTLDFTETPEGLLGGVEYNTDLFNKDRIERMIGHFNVLVESITANPMANILDLEILTPAERHKLLVEWNNTTVDYPKDKCIHQLFETQVEKAPDSMAVVFEKKQLTYRELNEKSNQLGCYLQSKGVKPDSLVGISVNRSLEMIVGLLGILKAGGAYVPIDPTYPEGRISYMLEDADCEIVLTQKHLKLPETSSKIVYLDADWDEIEKEPIENVKSEVKSNNLAYVIYTSGSTGKPKGVCIEQKNIINLINFTYNKTNIDLSSVLQFISISFDVSVQEIFGTVLCGGKLCLVGDEIRINTTDLFKLISNNNIKTIFWPVSFIKMLFNNDNHRLIPQCVKHIITAGEQLVISNNFSNYLKENDVFLHNHYGPSETHVVTTLTLNPKEEHPNLPPIGKPIDNTQLYIIDKKLDVVPIGITGELCIAGEQLGRGYLKNPELTAEKFIRNPFSDDPNSRLYKTGDLVRYLPNGNIEFLGRIDNQVKIRGFRIELGEIESALNKIKVIKDNVVVVKEDAIGNKRLITYIVSDDELNISEIRESLSKSLPDYMIPSLFVKLEKMPLTPNGKIDRKALPELEGNIETSTEYVSPTAEVETKMCIIWQEVLGIDRVGITDEFFSLGGNSILSIQVAHRMSNALGSEIRVSDIFRLKSIDKILAAQEQYLSLVKPYYFNYSHDLADMLFISPGRAGSEMYQDLADLLPSKYNCIGIDNYNIHNKNKIDSLNRLANHYLSEYEQKYTLKEPINLLGWSLGGQIALEIAGILEVRGYKHINVILLDTFIRDEIMQSFNGIQENDEDYLEREKNILIGKYGLEYVEKIISILDAEEEISGSPISNYLKHSNVTLFKAIQNNPDVNTKNYKFHEHYMSLKLNNIDLVADKVDVIKLECNHFDILKSSSKTISDFLLSKLV